MRIYVDADACPVVNIVESIAKEHCIPVTLLCDTNHILNSEYSEVVIVGAGADAVDFKLISLCNKGDIVVSQDYGVAAMALSKKAYAIHQSGKWYTDENIDQLLMERHLAKKVRRGNSKNHLKGPRKRTDEDDKRFAESFNKLIIKAIDEDENNSNLIPFPNNPELKNEIEKLRIELSMLLLERDQLLYVECKNLEMQYMLELGSIEYRLYEAQCTFLRLKRKLEIMQSKINRQENIVITEIDKVLDDEFAEYTQKLNKQMNKMNEAINRSKGTFLSDAENEEIKKLYRNIVKKLHPDLNPSLTAAQKEMFNNTIEAYKNGDINTLRIINEMICSDLPNGNEQNHLTKLRSEKERLMKMLENIKNSIDTIKAEFPYNMKDIIWDKDKMDIKKSELEDNLASYTELIDNYLKKINSLVVQK